MLQKTDERLSLWRKCDMLHINRSSLYYEPKEPDEAYQALQEELMKRIDYWHTKHPYLGSRKIAVKLQQEGYHVCRKTVRRIMGRMGIHAVYPKANLSKRNFKEAVVPYLLRNYKAEFPNQVWSIDITYIPMKRSHMYLTAPSTGVVGRSSGRTCRIRSTRHPSYVPCERPLRRTASRPS